MTAKIDPLNLCNVTLCMDSLITAAIPVALELITWCIKDRSLVDDQGASEMPATRFIGLLDLLPDLIGFRLRRQADILCTGESLTIAATCFIFGDDNCAQESHSESKHCSSCEYYYNFAR